MSNERIGNDSSSSDPQGLEQSDDEDDVTGHQHTSPLFETPDLSPVDGETGPVNAIHNFFRKFNGEPVDDLSNSSITDFLNLYGITTPFKEGVVMKSQGCFQENVKSLHNYRCKPISSPSDRGFTVFLLRLKSKCFYSSDISVNSWKKLNLNLDIPEFSLVYAESTTEIHCLEKEHGSTISKFNFIPAIHVIDGMIINNKDLRQLNVVERSNKLRDLFTMKELNNNITPVRCAPTFRLTELKHVSTHPQLKKLNLNAFGQHSLYRFGETSSGFDIYTIRYGVLMIPLTKRK